MDFSFLVPLIFMFIIISMVFGMLAMFGLTPANLAVLFSLSSRRKTEVQARDHFDRWDSAQRRSAVINKPRALKHLAIRGDEYVPARVIGTIKGATPWMSYYIVYVKTRRFSWSDPFIIPQNMASDLNRRNLWVESRGFSKVGPVYIPIPLDETKDLTQFVADAMEAFRFFFEQQIYMDITENMAWGIEHAMDSPIAERVRITEADAPGVGDHDYIPEDAATGGAYK